MNLSEQELLNLIRLQYVLGAGSTKSGKILDAFGGATHFFSCTDEQLRQSGLLSPKELERLWEADETYAENILKRCRENGIVPIGYDNTRFPERLRNISAPPLVLYTKGVFPSADEEPLFCIVGPRDISPFGTRAAYALSKRLTQAGMNVVTGIALGGDTAVLQGALQYAGKPIAVLPCGILYDYLPQNRSLCNKVATAGCLVSEYPPDHAVTRYAFGARNRLLSGLSVGVAVVEAAEKSGTLITAHHAVEQGRDVFVIPGNPTLPQYKGSNGLLRDGAKPLTTAVDIFEEYLTLFSGKIDPERAYALDKNKQSSEKFQKKSVKGLSNEAKIVYNYLDKQKFTVDDCVGAGLSGGQLLAALTELEFEDYITALPGGFYAIS